MRSCSGSLIMLPALHDDWAHCRQQWQWVPLLLNRVKRSLKGHCSLLPSLHLYRRHTLRHSNTAARYTGSCDNFRRPISCLLFTSVKKSLWPDQDTARAAKSLSLHTFANMSPDPSLPFSPLGLWLLSQNMPYTWLMLVIFVHFGYCQFHHAALASHCRCDMQQNDANPVDLHTLGPSTLFPSSVLKWPSKSRNEQIWIYDSPIC